MKRIGFYFDVISPFAYLAFERMPQVLEGCSYEVQYRPTLLAGLLGHWGQKGPAEVEPKRVWTFRHVQWLAHQAGLPLRGPAVHPFNPLPLLRLALACAPAGGLPNRRVAETLLRHVWNGDGGDATEHARVQALAAALQPQRDPAGDDVKRELRAITDDAVSRGVFGVPTFELAGRLFWGLDSLPMLRAALQGDAWFDGPAWERAAVKLPGVTR